MFTWNFWGTLVGVTSLSLRMRTPVRMMQRMLTRVRVRLTRPSRKDSSGRSSEYLAWYPPVLSERFVCPLGGGNPVKVVEFCWLRMNSTRETDQRRPQLTAGGRREAEMATPTRLPALPSKQ